MGWYLIELPDGAPTPYATETDIGEVCEECRNEVDDKSSSIRKEKK